MTVPLRFGVLGTGSIAAEVADALSLSDRCAAQSVGSRDLGRAQAFAAEHSVRQAAGSYEEVISDPEVDVVYVATPHAEHERWTLSAIGAGKHVLCEKPLTMDAVSAERVQAAARAADVFLLEAFAYWFHPQTELLLSLVRSGAIGEVRAIDVSFSYAEAGQSGDRVSHTLAGGGIRDVGCYCTSMAARIAAAANGLLVAEPSEVVGLAVCHETARSDEYAAAVMRFPGRILANLVCGVSLTRPDVVRILGTSGYMETSRPAWVEGHRSDATWVDVHRPGESAERHHIPGGPHIFTREVDGMASLLAGDAASREATTAESLANMRTLDRWREAVGLR